MDFMRKTLESKQVKEKKRNDKKGVKRKALSSTENNKVNALDVYGKEVENKEFNFENVNKVLDPQPSLLSGGVLKPYQLEGYNWMKTLYENAVNGILADEMGLGKTIQTLAFISHLVEMSVSGPFLVVGPLSTVPNWCDEIKRFAPDIPVVMYHGTGPERAELHRKIMRTHKLKGGLECRPIVVTSYSIALIDVSKLKKIEWKVLVIDEAHRIKNFQCKLIEALKKYNTSHRVLLTGTPLQNDLTELWSLLNFILPEIFSDLKVFQAWFDMTRLTKKSGTMEIIAQEQEKQIVSTIHQILTPFLLRRTKADVELSLPPKKEIIVHAPFTNLQKEYYNATLNQGIEKLLNIERGKLFEVNELDKRRSKKTSFWGVDDGSVNLDNAVHVSNKDDSDCPLAEVNIKMTHLTTILRKICGHPYLVSYPIDPMTDGYLVDENIVTQSGKLLVLDCMLKELKKRGHKVLLFSQFVIMLDILEDFCTFRGYKFCRLQGNVKLTQRQISIQEFNNDESLFIFLISTRAGGLGINLTAADTVIIYDSDWNPQGDLQAQDRCHRIGQTKPVVVYRLVVPNTIDERIVDIAEAKRKLEKMIIKKGRFKSIDNMSLGRIGVTKEELVELLLHSSDVDAFVKTNENDVLSPEELDKLLDRSDMISISDKKRRRV